MYKKPINLDAFKYAYENSKNPLCFNGDLFALEDVKRIEESFPNVKAIMFGRGILMNPGLIYEIKHGEPAPTDMLKEFLDLLLDGYVRIIPDKKHIIMKMKELWFYLQNSFSEEDKVFKKIKKIKNIEEYKVLERQILQSPNHAFPH